ncbi:hypothetical protein CEXT_495751 [Caerostris extrusa]|uniref:Uncharacterized protein n=1 Tax=Caerostris extrusa TaxID=172846 RepID=A0AAV4RXG8_CAEEX|nr:hypothetical protein CEXT_495751 [Caerostris extrusa]
MALGKRISSLAAMPLINDGSGSRERVFSDSRAYHCEAVVARRGKNWLSTLVQKQIVAAGPGRPYFSERKH